MTPQPQPPFSKLDDWLRWQENLHPSTIELGLERVAEVGQSLNVLQPAPRVITIAGTNGKGSSAALLEQTLLKAGQRTAVYSSPHLLRYNERLRLNGLPVDDAEWCAAFMAVETARCDTALTYFEFGTLAALYLIQQNPVDIAILEVGLGGRLDAVNIVNADIALITNIGLDHLAWLGDNREAIAREKAGIMRHDRPVVYAEDNAPTSLLSYAESSGAKLCRAAVDYQFAMEKNSWRWTQAGQSFEGLSIPALCGKHFLQNAAGVLAVLQQLEGLWCIADFNAALQNWFVAGRCEWRNDQPFGLLLDVAHNSEAARELADVLAQQPCIGQTFCLFAVLQDKPVADMLSIMSTQVSQWHFASLDAPRGLKAQSIQAVAEAQGIQGQTHSSLASAWKLLKNSMTGDDRLVVFGSFHTVEAVTRILNQE